MLIQSESNRTQLLTFVPPGELLLGTTLVTGDRGIGKTRWCMGLADYAISQKLDVCGLVSPAVMDQDQKVGIDLLDLSSGEQRRLASRNDDAEGDPLLMGWKMNPDTLKWGNSVIRRIKLCDIFILDELGPLEFRAGIGLTEGIHFIDTRSDLPVFVVVRPSLLNEARQRWPWGMPFNPVSQRGQR